MIGKKVQGCVWVRVFFLSLAILFIMTGAQAMSASPSDTIKSLLNEVLGILNNPALQGDAHRTQKVDLVEKATARHFDYREMAKRTLEGSWNSLNQSQQDEFVKNFSGLLKASYACRLDEFTKATVSYQPEILKADYAEVPTVILRPNDKIPVTFRMFKKSQDWMICDLVIEGVSLAENYKGQFSRIIQGASFNELLKVLQTKMQEECKPRP